MACCLKQTDVNEFSAAADSKVRIVFQSVLGAEMTSVLVTDKDEKQTRPEPAGNSVTLRVPQGRNTVIFTFAANGTDEKARLVEDCGDAAGTTQTLAYIDTGDVSGFGQRLYFIGVDPSATVAAEDEK